MLREIGTVDRIPEYIARAKDKDDPFRLMGFGHRVYKNFDPRAKVMKESADEVLELMGIHNNPTLQVAKELERIALEDDYFISKKLYPNVDFYSGIILDAMGFPTSMFTPIFALSRTVGWIAQWKEMIGDPTQKIGRPRQLYIGEAQPRLCSGVEPLRSLSNETETAANGPPFCIQTRRPSSVATAVKVSGRRSRKIPQLLRRSAITSRSSVAVITSSSVAPCLGQQAARVVRDEGRAIERHLAAFGGHFAPDAV